MTGWAQEFMRVSEIRGTFVPYWGPHYKGILLFGVYFRGSPLFVNPHVLLEAHIRPKPIEGLGNLLKP